MMDTIPLYALVEAASADPHEKQFTGNISDIETFTKRENLEKLEARHRGVFAFIAYHPAADAAVDAYVKGKTLGSDAGAHVLVLFTESAAALPTSSPPDVPRGVEGVELDSTEHPAYTIVRWLFPTSAPALPGILLFHRFCGEVTAVFVSLATLDTASVRQRAREMFEAAADVYRSAPAEFGDRIGVALTRRGVRYVKSERLSMNEWLAKAWRLVREKKYELVAFAASWIPKPWPSAKKTT